MLLGTVLAAMGLSGGAAVPDTAMANDDDNGDNGGNYQLCSGTEGEDPNPNDDITVQICTITPADGTNETCIQRSSDPVVRQTCIFTQEPTVPASNNRVTVIQIADQHGAEGLLDAEQKVQGQQSNTTGHNIANVTQEIKQVLASGIDDDDDGDDDDDNGEADEDDDGEPDDDNGEENGPPDMEIAQNEQAHQWVDICQGGTPCDAATGMSGRNESRVSQSQTQREFAANAEFIFQFQNFEPRPEECSPGPPPNDDDDEARACYMVQQHTMRDAGAFRDSCPSPSSSSRPANLSCLTQLSDQLQVARNADGGHQGQGFFPDEGGLDHSFTQMSPGIALLFADQDERQTQSRTNTGLMDQHQFGNLRKGSGIQETNENNLTDVDQFKVQDDGTGDDNGDGNGDDDGDDDDDNGDGFSAIALENGYYELPTGQTGSARVFAETSGDCVAHIEVRQEDGQGDTAQEPSGDDEPVTRDFCAEFVLCGDEFGEPFPEPPGEGDTCVSSDDECPEGFERNEETGLCELADDVTLTGLRLSGASP
jgi:hypothetical protein